jgi:stage II sporulation protein M
MDENTKNYSKIILKEVKESFIDNKKIILTVTVIFFFFGILGYFIYGMFTSPINHMFTGFAHHVKSVEPTSMGLFINNSTTACILFLGSLLLGIGGIFEIFVSSFFLGVTAAMTAQKGKILLFFLLIIPHGIFEIPALILASSSGFVMLSFVISFLKKLKSPDKEYLKVLDSKTSLNNLSLKDKMKMSWMQNKFKFKQSIILFIVCIILLVIAAIIEGNITQPLGLAIYGFLT